MDDRHPDQIEVRAALADAAREAGRAPSIHNTQPWRWRVVGTSLELWAVRDRQLAHTDDAGRMLAISCGSALYHARLAMAARGWNVAVELLPDPDAPDLLARMTPDHHGPTAAASVHDLQLLRVRRTDRRMVSEEPPPPDALDAITAAVDQTGAHLYFLRPDDVIDLASAADHARRVEVDDPRWRAELDYWTGDRRADDRLGVPDAVIPAEPPATTVPGRDFGHGGSLPVGAGHDGAARYAILFGPVDTAAAWLRAGEALTAGWIAALRHGLTVVPLSTAIEVPATRVVLRRLLANLGEPFLVLRIGSPDPDEAGPDHTPRLPADQTVEVVGS